MTNTGVFATKEELALVKEKAERACTTPVMALSLADGLAGRDFASLAHMNAMQTCHALALKHGLPEIEGFYGMDNDGEFVCF